MCRGTTARDGTTRTSAADEGHRGPRRLATGRVRHVLFRAPVRRMLEKAPSDPKVRGILFDNNAKDFLDNLEMKKVLAVTPAMLGRKFDILGMDSCLMSMSEVGCQVSGGADYTVGFEQTEPG